MLHERMGPFWSEVETDELQAHTEEGDELEAHTDKLQAHTAKTPVT